MFWLCKLGILRGNAFISRVGPPPPLGQAAFPLTSPAHTQLLSFLLTELFFLILIRGGCKAKLNVLEKSES